VSPLEIACTDLSLRGETYAWDFGDGGTSSARHPQHAYAAAGTYTVTLTVSNAAGSDTATTSVTVTGVP
jgi:PKD repeat protein